MKHYKGIETSGIYCWDYEMWVDKGLKYCPYGQCGVKFAYDGAIVLFSYSTDVIYIDKDGWLTCTGLYSATTRKHIGAFMKEYTKFTYQDAKKCYLDNMKLNIYTAEVQPIHN